MADALINSPGGTGVAETDEFRESTRSRDNHQTCASLESGNTNVATSILEDKYMLVAQKKSSPE